VQEDKKDEIIDPLKFELALSGVIRVGVGVVDFFVESYQLGCVIWRYYGQVDLKLILGILGKG
jgi:hypothetical protein